MRKYWNNVQDEHGNPRYGASVAVQQSGVNSTIYSDSAGSTTKTNPLTTDSTRGYFEFYAPSGVYDLVVTGVGFASYTITAGAEIGIRSTVGIDVVADYGCDSTGVADSSVKAQAAHDAAVAAGYVDLIWPQGTYLLNTTLNWSPYVTSRSNGLVILKTTSANAKMFNVSSRYGNTTSFTAAPIFDGKFRFWNAGTATSGLFLGDTAGSGFGVADQCVARGCEFYNFARGVEFSNYAYILSFENCYFNANTRHLFTAAGLTNMGERISFSNCLFASAGNQVYTLNTGMEFFFAGCSFDYNVAVTSNSTGDQHFNNCHFEWSTTNFSVWDLLNQSLHLSNCVFNFTGASTTAAALIARIGANTFLDAINCTYRIPIAGTTGYLINAVTATFNGPANYYFSNNNFLTYVSNAGGGTLHTF